MDLRDPDTFALGVPHGYFERLRREAPLSWHRGPDPAGFIAVTRFREIARIAKDPDGFSSARNGTILVAWPPGVSPPPALTHLDPPRQREVRAVVQPFFFGPKVDAMEPLVRMLTRRILDRIGPLGEVDCPHELASLPMEVTAHILGVPDEDLPRVRLWSELINSGEDPEFARLIASEQPLGKPLRVRP